MTDLNQGFRSPTSRRPNVPAPKSPAPKRPGAQTSRRPNVLAPKRPACKRPAPWRWHFSCLSLILLSLSLSSFLSLYLSLSLSLSLSSHCSRQRKELIARRQFPCNSFRFLATINSVWWRHLVMDLVTIDLGRFLSLYHFLEHPQVSGLFITR